MEIQPRNGQIANVETPKCSNSLNCDLNVNGILDATNLDFTILFYILHFEQFLGQTFVSSFIRKNGESSFRGRAIMRA